MKREGEGEREEEEGRGRGEERRREERAGAIRRFGGFAGRRPAAGSPRQGPVTNCATGVFLWAHWGGAALWVSPTGAAPALTAMVPVGYARGA